MLTQNHGLLAFWFNKFLNQKLETKVHPAYIMTGAILPDIFLVFYFFLKTTFLVVISKSLHSVPIFVISFIVYLLLMFLSQDFRYGRAMAFFIGWGFFHIAIDMVTHKTRAWPYFWPWLDSPIHGIADHNNPILFTVETILTIYIFYCITLWLVKRITKKTS